MNPVARWVGLLGVVLAIATCVGWVTTPSLGGLGLVMFWLGILSLPVVWLVALVLAGLTERYPGIQPAVGSISKTCAGTAVLGLLVLTTLEMQYRESNPIPRMQFENKQPLIYLQRPDPILGWRGAPNFTKVMDFLSGVRQFTTNSRGFRDIEQELDPDRPRVVVIGDSVPLGWGGDVEDSLTPRLRKILPDAQLFNASWQAYTKDQIAWSYRVMARPLSPKVVVMMFLSDPFEDTSQPLYYGWRKPYYLLDGEQLILKGTPVRFDNSAVQNRTFYRNWQIQRITGPVSAWHYLTHDFIRTHSAFGRQVLNTLQWREVNNSGMPPINALESKILSKLKAEIEADGAHLIVVPTPRKGLFQHAEDPVRAMQRHLEGYRRLGIDTFDITPLLLGNWAKCFNQDAHPNALAIKRIQRPLSERIRSYLTRE